MSINGCHFDNFNHTTLFQLKQERTVTDEHIEYDSDDSACSSSSSESSRSSYYQLRPEEYQTRTEESFTEYFVKGNGDEKVLFHSKITNT